MEALEKVSELDIGEMTFKVTDPRCPGFGVHEAVVGEIHGKNGIEESLHLLHEIGDPEFEGHERRNYHISIKEGSIFEDVRTGDVFKVKCIFLKRIGRHAPVNLVELS